MHAYHTFLLLKTDEGCNTVTEEVVKGPGAVEFREKRPSAMHEGNDLWLKPLSHLRAMVYGDVEISFGC